jgi:NAD(P)-dependent dehydrogenase (short-subunit alcohol dehydrogenase family)
MADLTGKVAIVTGAASGIGRATAEVLAADGASVLIADINAEKAQEVADQIVGRGQAAAGFGVDVGEEEQVRAMVEAAVTKYGRLDILHNNAALTSADVISRDQKWTDFDPALFERVMRVNVGATRSVRSTPYPR